MAQVYNLLFSGYESATAISQHNVWLCCDYALHGYCIPSQRPNDVVRERRHSLALLKAEQDLANINSYVQLRFTVVVYDS